MPDRVYRKLTSEAALGTWIIVFAFLCALSLAVSSYAIQRGFRTEGHVKAIVRRVVRIETPSLATQDRELHAAVRQLSPSDALVIRRKALAEERRLRRHHGP